MINLAELGRVFIVCGKTDMRRGIDSLAYIVKKSFNLDPFSGCVFLFCGSRRDRFKALYWDGQGFWMLYKRFENGKLAWPNNERVVRRASHALEAGLYQCSAPLQVKSHKLINPILALLGWDFNMPHYWVLTFTEVQ